MNERFRLTEAELDILSVLWERHGATVKEVSEILGEKRQTSYTTFLKTMQIMFDKKLVQRDQKTKAHVYFAALDRFEVGKQLLSDTLQKVYAGSAIEMVTQILQLQEISSKDKKKIQKQMKQDRRADKASAKQSSKSSHDKKSKVKKKKIILKEI